MADTVETPAATTEQAQVSIEMPDGVTLTGIGGDTEALREQFETRQDEIAPAAPVVEAPKPAAEVKPPTRGQKRFAELTREREDANRRAEAAEAKLKEFEAKQAAPVAAAPVAPVQSPALPVPAAPVAPVVPAVVQPTRPEPTEEEVGTKYPTYSAFVKDLAAWTVEQERTKLYADIDARSTARIEADRASRTRMSYVNDQVFPAGKAAYQDFDAVLSANTTITPHVVHDAILALPDPKSAADVLYLLSKDQAKLTEVISLAVNPLKLGIAIAQLIPRESVALPASTAPVVRTTNAPAPPQPVGAGSRTTSPSIEELASKGEYEAYKAARAAQRAS
jgi:hypothetical protein